MIYLQTLVFLISLSLSIYSASGFLIWIIRYGIYSKDEIEKKFDKVSIKRYNISITLTVLFWSLFYFLIN